MPLLAERSIRWRGCNMTLQLGRNKLVVHYAFRGCFATFGNSNLSCDSVSQFTIGFGLALVFHFRCY